jgi:hypothetical protein
MKPGPPNLGVNGLLPDASTEYVPNARVAEFAVIASAVREVIVGAGADVAGLAPGISDMAELEPAELVAVLVGATEVDVAVG